MVEVAYVKIWGDVVGAVSWQGGSRDGHSEFEFDTNFLKTGLNVSPIHMGLEEARTGNGRFTFSGRNRNPSLDTFMGLPGMLADSLPDKFGNRIIDTWLQRQGRDVDSFSPLERLCYIGNRGMGALEYVPSLHEKMDKSVPVEIARLVELAHAVTTTKSSLNTTITGDEKSNQEALLEILRVGTSAGGARAKAIIAMNKAGHTISGQSQVPKGYDHCILKFDGVSDLELGTQKGYGRIEYAYYLMAKDAGIIMPDCKLLFEGNGRAHFMTKRFDRVHNRKIHMQSLCGIAHYDYNAPGAYGYEQAFSVMRQLKIAKSEAVEQFRRMVFNVVSRNQDDHTKNISFLMDVDGNWSLSPAYDITFAHNPGGTWTNSHQMTINGKRDNFTIDDLLAVGRSIQLPKTREIIDEVVEVVSHWPEYASRAGVKNDLVEAIEKTHRLSFDKTPSTSF